MNQDLTVAVLLYGDHAPLARRCLSSILPAWAAGDFELRILCNGVSESTKETLGELRRRWPGHDERLSIHDGPRQPNGEYPKYPTMRMSLYGDPPVGRFLMWFDDDSFVRPGGEDVFSWAPRYMDETGLDLLGSMYLAPFRGGQVQWIRRQPWFKGVPHARLRGMPAGRFATGGWWTVRSEILFRHDYPWRELYHNGGDVMLGELMRQQGYRMPDCTPPGVRTRVAINADEAGSESAARRRGLSTPPIGSQIEESS